MRGINRHWPGLNPQELTEHFFRLWDKGLVECAEGEGEPAIAPEHELAKQQFEHDEGWPHRSDGISLTYRLSVAGGEVWEHYARADGVNFSAVGAAPWE